MALNDTRLRSLKPKSGKTERLVADGNGLCIGVRVGEGRIVRDIETGKVRVTRDLFGAD
jgi:hypothetical protein